MSAQQKKPSRKGILLPIITCIVFSISLIPPLLYGLLFWYSYPLLGIWILPLLPIFLYIGIVIVILSLLLISGCFIRLFNITYTPGIYEYSFSEKNAFRWMIVCSLYTPCRKIIETFPLGRIKNTYYRLIGMKIGKNTLVGGTIKDPCITTFGDNVTMGEYAIIYGHIHNQEKGTLIIKKVTIEDNCVIGAGAIIMPGVTMQTGAVIGAASLATKDKILEKNKTYVGNPLKELPKKKPKEKQ